MSALGRRALLACLLAASVAHAQPAPAPAAPAPAPAPAATAPAPTAPAPAATTPVTPAPAQGFGVDVQLGFGVGSTRFERPLLDGTSQRLADSAFGALDATLRLQLPSCACMSLSTALRYRSSLGFQVEQSPPFALESAQDVRVQRLELSARALWQVGRGGWSPELGLELGVAVASFVPELHDRLAPKYALAGPLLRPLGRVTPLDWLVLQLGPELSWIALVDGSLGEDGAGDQGYAVGAELSARARLVERLWLELDARSSISVVSSDGDRADFEDAARFLTLGLSGEL